MRAAAYDLGFLWASRHSSGFPWPFRWGTPESARWRTVRRAVLGYPTWSPVPVRRQIARVPTRPVRSIARTRSMVYRPAMYDEVP